MPAPDSRKTVLITGSTGGIGIETAIGVAKKGARLLVTARNPVKGLKGVDRIKKESGNEAVQLYLVDFSSQPQIRKFCESVKRDHAHLDVLVNNVGGGGLNRTETEDGNESTFALNHLSHFMVTHLLMDRLLAAPEGRIVNVSSGLHHVVKFDFEDVHSEKNYLLPVVYAKAKLANLLWSYRLAELLNSTSVTLNLADPGISMTEGLDKLIGEVDPMNFRWANPFYHYMYRAFTPKQAAKSSIYLATSQLLGDMHAAYLDPEKKVIKSSEGSYRKEDQERICRLSEELTGVKFEVSGVGSEQKATEVPLLEE